MMREGLNKIDARNQADRIQRKAGSESPPRRDLDKAEAVVDREDRAVRDIVALVTKKTNTVRINPRFEEQANNPNDYPVDFMEAMIMARQIDPNVRNPFPGSEMLYHVDRALEQLFDFRRDLEYVDRLARLIKVKLPFGKDKAIKNLTDIITNTGGQFVRIYKKDSRSGGVRASISDPETLIQARKILKALSS